MLNMCFVTESREVQMIVTEASYPQLIVCVIYVSVSHELL
jgi:hypothetical protein